MFTELPLLSLTIFDVICFVCVVPSAYVILIFPPVKSSLSPCSYSVFVGGVIVIFFAWFVTSTS